MCVAETTAANTIHPKIEMTLPRPSHFQAMRTPRHIVNGAITLNPLLIPSLNAYPEADNPHGSHNVHAGLNEGYMF